MTIKLDVTWSEPSDKDADGIALAWGRGLLLVDDKPVWFAGTKVPEPLEWSWIELLEFLAHKWAYIVSEQAYPLDLTPDEPRNLRRELSRALERVYNEAEIDRYDEDVFRFEDRHDLSRALHGLRVPSVFVLREGNEAWVTTNEVATRFSFAEVCRDLEAIGAAIAERISARRGTSARADAALTAWARRGAIRPSLLIRLATGIPSEEFSEQLPDHNLEFWELEAVPGADSEIACAARLVKGGYASATDRVLLASAVRKLAPVDTALLDQFASKLKRTLERKLTDDPFEQGYELALQVRSDLELRDGIVHPDRILQSFLVAIVEIRLSPMIDAVGCWGPKHGPAVLLNRDGKHSSSQWGRRATLAHELCHLLVDRSRSLPFAEVLGGRSPYRLERRANAFAAELLLPRWAAREEYARYRSAEPTLDALIDKFGVGQVLAANQLKNARPPRMTISERAYLESIVHDNGGVEQSDY